MSDSKPSSPSEDAQSDSSETQDVDLPEGWEEHFSYEQQRLYYYNAETGETRWERPGSPGESGWRVFYTPGGRPYYHNQEKDEVVWEKPEELMEEKEKEMSTEQWEYEEQGGDPWEHDHYFSSYAGLELQGSMVHDRPRSLAYMRGLMHAGLEGKVVLDVGCGTGLLSHFAIRGGAEKVFAVEASGMASVARRVVEHTGMEGRIEVIHKRVEEVELPAPVDCVISEWMGSLLVFESMIEAVVVARNRWLKEGGSILPSSARMYVAPIDISDLWEEKVGCWKDVYGVDMSVLQEDVWTLAFGKSVFNQAISPSCLLSQPLCFCTLDMAKVQVEHFERIETDFEFVCESERVFHGFACWFDVSFAAANDGVEDVLLSTSPDAEPTHWCQELFIMRTPTPVSGGTCIKGNMVMERNSYWRRHYNVDWRYTVDGGKQHQRTFDRWRSRTPHKAPSMEV